MGSERERVQQPLIDYARKCGWEYLKAAEAQQLRRGLTARFFYDILEEKLLSFNKDILNQQRAKDIMEQLRRIQPTIEGNREALSWLRGEKMIYVEEEKRNRNVQLIDFENPDNNVYHVTDEWRQYSDDGVHSNRADVVFLINGIPVVVVETKSAFAHEGLTKALEQIRRYHKQTPELFALAQMFVITQVFGFIYCATWNTDHKSLINWRDEFKGDFEQRVTAFFDPVRLLRTLHTYIVFMTRDETITKVILRQHQARAVEKVLERVEEKEKRRALIWHTQGSGKTLTIITIATEILRSSTGEKPLVLIITDRIELEQQMHRNLESCGITGYDKVETQSRLEQMLEQDQRGLVVCMMHKFSDLNVNKEKLKQYQRKVVVLIDEAHRTTGGAMGTELMAVLPDAYYIGFTGTPIDKIAQGKGTFKTFGVDDNKGFLDKYSIEDAIKDGATVKLHYGLARSELLADKDKLEQEFFQKAQEEGVQSIESLNAVLDRAVNLTQAMKGQRRIEKVAKFVADHYKEHVEPMGFKAFLVAVDREACVLYRKELLKHFPKEEVEVVYSSNNDDEGDLKTYSHSDREEREIRRNFIKRDKNPKILIVTEKLLTGYDAPILYCMYLDKPMKDHALLQAIARVNRPYEDEQIPNKPCGYIIDFVGIFDKLERALAFDSDFVNTVIDNVETLKASFKQIMESEQAQEYLPYARKLVSGKNRDKDLEEATQYFVEDQERQDAFRQFSQNLQSLFDILAPDPYLDDYLDDYKAIIRLYRALRELIQGEDDIANSELTRKTRQLLQASFDSTEITAPDTIYELDREHLTAIKQRYAPTAVSLFELRKVIKQIAEKREEYEPYLRPIGERAEAIIKEFQDRQISTQKALDEMAKQFEQLQDVDEIRKRYGEDIDINTFSIFVELKREVLGITPEQAKQINEIIQNYPNYDWDTHQERELRSKLNSLVGSFTGMVKSSRESVTKALKLVSNILKLKRIK